MKSFIKSSCAIVLALAISACSPPAIPTPNTETNNSTAYIESLIKSNGKDTIKLNMADTLQYDYVKDAFLAAGETPQKAARLFADLDKARAAALCNNQPHNLADKGATVTFEDYYEARPFMVSYTYAYNGQFYVSLTSTVKPGSEYTSMLVRVTDTKTGKVLSSGVSGWVILNQYTGGKCVVLVLDFPLPATNDWTVIKIEGIEQIIVNGEVENYSTIVNSIIGNGMDSNMEGIVIEEPADKNKDSTITVSLNNSPYCTNTDYPYAGIPYSIAPAKVNLPLKGYFQLPFKLTRAQIDTANTNIMLSGWGINGAIVNMFFQGNLNSLLKCSEAPNKGTFLSWDISRQNGVFTGSYLFSRMSKVNWYIRFTFTNIEIMPGWVESSLIYCASSDVGANGFLPALYPPALQFCY